MKNFLLVVFSIFITAFASAQAVVSIMPPSDFAGIYDFTITVDTDLPWGTPDLEDPANAILGILAVGRDGTEEDSLGCEELINGDEIAGKIALIYRNTCFFDQKCLHAQNAGAIGVIIVNRLGAEPINMTSPNDGTGVGDQVTIPVVMVQGEEVLNWRTEVDAGILEAFIGNKSGFFGDDLGMNPNGVLRAEFFSYPTTLAQNGNYIVQMGADIINYGTNTQDNVSLSAVIEKDGSVLYNETSDAVLGMETGDTVAFDLPSFTMDEFTAGLYTVTYEVVYGEEDQFPGDNILGTDFMISNDLISYATVDPETNTPNASRYFRPSGATGSVHSCIAFKDPNASEIGIVGITYSATYDNDFDMTGISVFGFLYEWTNDFEDVNDVNFDLTTESLDELAIGAYEYPNDDMRRENIFIAFEDGVVQLEDNVRYLFCINYFDEDERLFTGFDNNKVDYTKNFEFYQQPLWPLENNDAWSPIIHFTDGLNVCPSIAANLDFPDAIKEEGLRVEITPFPNPASGQISIPIGDNFGKTLIDIYDIAGKRVKSLNVSATSSQIIRVNVSDLDNGAYIFKMNFEDGSFSNFNVIVNN